MRSFIIERSDEGPNNQARQNQHPQLINKNNLKRSRLKSYNVNKSHLKTTKILLLLLVAYMIHHYSNNISNELHLPATTKTSLFLGLVSTVSAQTSNACEVQTASQGAYSTSVSVTSSTYAYVGDYTAYIDQITFCRMNANKNHIGFRARWTDASGGSVHTYDYGNYMVGCPGGNQQTANLPAQLSSFQVIADENDVEGYIFTHSGGTETVETSNGGPGTKQDQPSEQISGPLIGFQWDAGTGGDGTSYGGQIIYIRAIYSVCACPTATWNAYTLPSTSGTLTMLSQGSDFSLNLPAPTNTVSALWTGQDCGSFTVELVPQLDGFVLSNTGGGSPPLIDTLTVKHTQVTAPGIYTIQIEFKQDSAQGIGYNLPYQGVIPQTISKTFTMTIEPCAVTTFTATTQPGMVFTYTIGTTAAQPNFNSYANTQNFACGYTETEQVSGNPLVLVHNPLTKDYSIPNLITDRALHGTYPITYTSRIQYTQTSGTVVTKDIAYTWSFVIVDPCLTLTFDAAQADFVYTIGSGTTSKTFGGFSDASCSGVTQQLQYQDGAGIWRQFTNPSLSFINMSGGNNFDVLTSDFTLHNTVQAMRYELVDPTAVGGPKLYHNEFSVTLQDPCAADELSITSPLTPTVYQIGIGNLDLPTAYTQTVPSCPLTAQMFSFDATLNIWVENQTILTNVASFQPSNAFRINTSDASYGPQTILSVKLVFTSTRSQHATKAVVETVSTLTIETLTVCSAAVFTKTAEISDKIVTEGGAPFFIVPPYTTPYAKGTCSLSATLTYVDPTNNSIKSFTTLPANPDFEWLSQFIFDDTSGTGTYRAGSTQLQLTTLTQFAPTNTLPVTLTITNNDSASPSTTAVVFNFDITLRDQCLDQVLSETTGVAAGTSGVITYTGVPQGGTQPTLTENGPVIGTTIATATCNINYELQVWTGSSFVAGTPTYMQAFNPSTAQMTIQVAGTILSFFDIDSDSNATGQTHRLRIVTKELTPLTNQQIFSEFQIKFAHQCAGATLTITAPSMNYVLGSGQQTATFIVSSDIAGCQFCFPKLFFTDSSTGVTTQIDGLTTLPWIVSIGANAGLTTTTDAAFDLVIDVPNTADHVLYLPEKTYGGQFISKNIYSTSTDSASFTVKIFNNCSGNVISVTSGQTNIVYPVTVAGTTLGPVAGPVFSWTESGNGCTVTRDLQVYNGVTNVWEPHTSYPFTFTAASGQFTFSTTYANAVLQGWMPVTDLLVKAVVTDGLGLVAESTFTIQLRDQCADNTLTETAYTKTNVNLPMDGTSQTRQIAFTNPSTGCTVTHKLYQVDLVTGTETEITANGNVFTWNSASGLLTFSVTGGGAIDLSLRPSTTYLWKLQVLPDRAINQITQGLTFSFSSTHTDQCLNNVPQLSVDQSAINFQVAATTPAAQTFATQTVVSGSLKTLALCPITVTTSCLDDATGSFLSINNALWTNWLSTYAYNAGTGALTLDVQMAQVDYLASYPTSPTVTFQCKIEAVDPRSSLTLTPTTVTDSFKVVIYDSCSSNLVKQGAFNMGAVQYFIDDAPQNQAADLYQTIAACPTTTTFEIQDPVTLAWINQASSPFSFVQTWTSASKQLTLFTNDFSTYDQVPFYKVLARITLTDVTTPTLSVTDNFTIEIVEKCRLATITGSFITTSTILTPNQLMTYQTWANPIGTHSHSQTAAPRCTASYTVMYDDASRTPIAPATASLTTNMLTVKFDFVYSGALLARYSVLLNGSETIAVQEKQIWFNVVDACTASTPSVIPQSIAAMVYVIQTPATTLQRTLTPFQSMATAAFGGSNGNAATLCGPISYALYDADQTTVATAAYLTQTVDGSQNVIISVSTSDVVYYSGGVPIQYYLRVSLDNYITSSPSTAHTFISFTVQLDSCQVTTITSDPDTTLTYSLGTPIVYQTYSAFGIIQCGVSISTYSTSWLTYYGTTLSTIPNFITWNPGSTRFEVLTSDLNDLTTAYHTYQIQLKGAISLTLQNPEMSKTQTFTFVVDDACTGDTFSIQNNNFADQIYYIGVNTQSPTLTYSAGVRLLFQQVRYNFNAMRCPMNFEVQIQDADLTWRSLTFSESSHVSVQSFYNINLNTPTSSQTFDPRVRMNIQTADYSLDQQTWILKLVATSTRSTQPAVEVGPFSYQFRDVCRDLPLVGATLSQNQYNLSLYTSNTITYTNPQDAPGWVGFATSCGPWTFTLHYDSTVSGNTPSDTSDATIASLFVNNYPATSDFTFTISLNDWVGNHRFRLDTNFNSKQTKSTYFNVDLVHPCSVADTVCTLPSCDLPQTHTTSLLSPTSLFAEFADMRDTASLAHGNLNGFDFCGDRLMQISYVDSTTGSTVVAYYSQGALIQENLQTELIKVQKYAAGQTGAQKSFAYSVATYQVEIAASNSSLLGLQTLTISWQLLAYPTALMNTRTYTMSIQVDPCEVLSITPPANLQVEYALSQGLSTIKYDFQQYPCEYPFVYTVTNASDPSQTLPTYLTTSTTQNNIQIKTSDSANLGSYNITISAQLDEYVTLLTNPATVLSFATLNPLSLPATFIYQSTFQMNFLIKSDATFQANSNNADLFNTAPYFQVEPNPQLVAFRGESFQTYLGQIVDDQADSVSVQVDFGQMTPFLVYDELNNFELKIEEGATDKVEPMIVNLVITLTDNNAVASLAKLYNIQMALIERKTFENDFVVRNQRERLALNEVQETYDERVYDLREQSEDTIFSNQQEVVKFKKIDLLDDSDAEKSTGILVTEEIQKLTPVPIIQSFSPSGLLRVQFTQPMQVPEQYDPIEEGEVALRWLQKTRQNIRNETYLTQEGFRDFEIRPALEIQITSIPEDGQVQLVKNLDFEYEIIDFEDQQMQIQIYFDEKSKELMQDPAFSENLRVTFWENDMFKSKEGFSVKQGATIQTKIVKQASIEEAKLARITGQITGYLFLALFVFMLVYSEITQADTLPLWVLFDTMQIIVHLPLFNIRMAPQTALYLSTISQILRLEFLQIGAWLKMTQNGGISMFKMESAMVRGGYQSPFFAINMASYLLLLLLAIFGYMLALICPQLRSFADRTFLKRRQNGRTPTIGHSLTSYVQNFTMRLLLATSLEVCICGFFDLHGNSYQTDFAYTSAIVGTTWLIVLLTVLLSVLFLAIFNYVDFSGETKDTIRSVVTLYLGYDYTKNGLQLGSQLALLYLCQRISYALIALSLSESSYSQIWLLIEISFVKILIFTKKRTVQYRVNRLMVLFNEFAVFLLLVLLLPQHANQQTFSVAYPQIYHIFAQILVYGIILADLVWLLKSLTWQKEYNFKSLKVEMQRQKILMEDKSLEQSILKSLKDHHKTRKDMESLFENQSNSNTNTEQQLHLEEVGMNSEQHKEGLSGVGLNFQSLAYGDSQHYPNSKSKQQKIMPTDIIGDLEASVMSDDVTAYEIDQSYSKNYPKLNNVNLSYANGNSKKYNYHHDKQKSQSYQLYLKDPLKYEKSKNEYAPDYALQNSGGGEGLSTKQKLNVIEQKRIQQDQLGGQVRRPNSNQKQRYVDQWGNLIVTDFSEDGIEGDEEVMAPGYSITKEADTHLELFEQSMDKDRKQMHIPHLDLLPQEHNMLAKVSGTQHTPHSLPQSPTRNLLFEEYAKNQRNLLNDLHQNVRGMSIDKSTPDSQQKLILDSSKKEEKPVQQDAYNQQQEQQRSHRSQKDGKSSFRKSSGRHHDRDIILPSAFMRQGQNSITVSPSFRSIDHTKLPSNQLYAAGGGQTLMKRGRGDVDHQRQRNTFKSLQQFDNQNNSIDFDENGRKEFEIFNEYLEKKRQSAATPNLSSVNDKIRQGFLTNSKKGEQKTTSQDNYEAANPDTYFINSGQEGSEEREVKNARRLKQKASVLASDLLEHGLRRHSVQHNKQVQSANNLNYHYTSQVNEQQQSVNDRRRAAQQSSEFKVETTFDAIEAEQKGQKQRRFKLKKQQKINEDSEEEEVQAQAQADNTEQVVMTKQMRRQLNQYRDHQF